MENKSHALMAGLFTLVLLIAGILISLWLNRDRVERVPYEMVTKLSVPGLNPQAAVRYRGLDVGKVDEITFDPQVPGQILVHFSVKPDTPITHSTYGVLGYQGVTGIAYVQLDDDGSKPQKLPSSKDIIARIEMRPSLFDTIQSKGQVILEQTQELTKRFNVLLAPENQDRMLNAFDRVSSAADAVKTIPAKLDPALEKLPTLVAQAQQSLVALAILSKDVSALTGNLNAFATQLQSPQGPVARIAASAQQLGAVAGSVEHDALPRINTLTTEARTSIRGLNMTIDNFNRQPQSILFGASGAAPGPGEPGFIAPRP